MCVIKGVILAPGWLPAGAQTGIGSDKTDDLPAEVENTLAELKRMKVMVNQYEIVGADTDEIRETLAQSCRALELKPNQCLVIAGEKTWIDAAAAGGFHNAGIGDAAYYEKAESSLNRFVEVLGCI